jgi:hypothetical protein
MHSSSERVSVSGWYSPARHAFAYKVRNRAGGCGPDDWESARHCLGHNHAPSVVATGHDEKVASLIELWQILPLNKARPHNACRCTRRQVNVEQLFRIPVPRNQEAHPGQVLNHSVEGSRKYVDAFSMDKGTDVGERHILALVGVGRLTGEARKVTEVRNIEDRAAVSQNLLETLDPLASDPKRASS